MRRASFVLTCVVLPALFVSCSALAQMLVLAAPPAMPQNHAHAAVTIPVSSLGYMPPGLLPALNNASLVSLNFVDSNHLLFSFNIPGLVERKDGCATDTTPQWVKTVILNINTGKVQNQVQWNIADNTPYIYPLRDGKFLLQRCTQIDIFNDNLDLQPFLNIDGRIRFLRLSADGSNILIESQHLDTSTSGSSGSKSKSMNLSFLRVPQLDVLTQFHVPDLETFPMFDRGFLLAKHARRNQWEIVFEPFSKTLGTTRVLTAVNSTCAPQLSELTSNSFLVSVCEGEAQSTMTDQAYDLSGSKLWQQSVDQNHLSRKFGQARNAHIVYAADLSRVAVGTLHTSHAMATENQINASSSTLNLNTGMMEPTSPFVENGEVDGQAIRVLDTRSGQAVFQFITTPIYSSGQNFALSPHGNRLAVLHDGAIEIYKLDHGYIAPAGR